MERPASVLQMLARYQEPVVFDEPLLTPDGVALGGHHRIVLERSGKFHYEGHARATGFPSFNFGVRALLDSGAGAPAVMAASGRVHGFNEPGDRESSWDQTDVNSLLTLHWLSFKGAKLKTDLNFDTDFFGTVGDVLTFVATLAGGALVAGPAGVCIVLGLHAAHAAGLDDEIGLGGLVGVAVAGGVLLVFGPSAIVAAIVAGAIAGVAVELAFKHRPMEPDEIAFANEVFIGTLPVEKILLTNMLGIGRRPFTMPTIGDKILVNLGDGFEDPIHYTGFGDGVPANPRKAGQLFIHELTHAWQIGATAFLSGLMCGAIANQSTTVGGNMSIYKYGPPDKTFSEFNLEQQASIVDDWFAGTTPEVNPKPKLEASTYFRYIRDNIRARVP